MKVSAGFLFPHITYRSTQTSHQNKPHVNKMLQAGIIKPVKEDTPWIKSFILVEGKDKSGNPKLYIGLDLKNLNKAIVHEPYHFKTPEDITR